MDIDSPHEHNSPNLRSKPYYFAQIKNIKPCRRNGQNPVQIFSCTAHSNLPLICNTALVTLTALFQAIFLPKQSRERGSEVLNPEL